jgi:hypothetical protein
MSDGEIVIPEQEFYELYITLACATSAAASGSPNQCASKAADAKQMVLRFSNQYRHQRDGTEGEQ